MNTEELEDLEVIPATRSPHGFLASPLTDNIHITDEGYLVVVGCPVARTGWQKYTVKDLPQKRAAELGIDISNPSATIDLYRPASEVFHPEFLASLNGKPITDGHPPGGDFVDPDNYGKYAMGHIQNVRKGPEPLEDGEWPVIADLMISAEPLIGKVRNKIARENSLGYDFSIDRDGDKIIQCSMLGNHSAVVPKGRAGDHVRIEDAAPEEAIQTQQDDPTTVPAAEVIEAIVYPPIKLSLKLDNKEKQPVSAMQKLLRLVGGKHLIESARATDADPEKIMELAEALHDSVQPVGAKARATDDAEPPKDTEKNEFKSEDKKAKDDSEPMDDARKKMHDALDSIMGKDKAKAGDSYSELKKLLDDFKPFEEKKDEPAVEDADPTDLEKVLAGGAEDCAECGTAHDADEECPGQEEVESGEEELVGDEAGDPDETDPDDDEDHKTEDKAKAQDRARAADGALATLRMLRPFAARSKDKDFHNAFNRALDSVKKSSRTSTGGYDKFASSARARDKAPRNPNPDRARTGDSTGKPDPMTALQQFYDAARKGGK